MRIPTRAAIVGARAWFAARRTFSPGILRDHALILAYHRVADLASNPSGLNVRPEKFDAQMRFIARHFTPIPLLDLVQTRLSGAPIPARSVVVTFDDGCRDNVVRALPILMRHGIPATFYLCTGFLDGTFKPWWEGAGAPMSWMEARKLVNAGMEIGAHSVNHPHFGEMTPAAVEVEIAESRERIQGQLGISVKSFAYPFGIEADVAVGRPICRRLDFACAVSTDPGLSPPDDDLFAMRRVAGGNWTAGEFALRVKRQIG